MLTISWTYVEGIISRHGATSDDSMGDWQERFWHQAPDKWRLELSTDLTYVSNGDSAAVISEGRFLRRGRPAIPTEFSAEHLLYPGRAALWAWPGDIGWSMDLDRAVRTDPGMQIPLVDGEGGDGEITVAMPEGYLKYMRLQNDIFLVDSLRTEPSAGTVLPLVFDPTLIL
ncbi:MAG TPA: hypothetical protein VMB79_14435 [Jatrophihabitans sp.]|nr:hypothetical protein [Jatrophihabitans sp.]